MKDIHPDRCPVPQEQRPVNEYQELKESWFFGWSTLELGPYRGKLLAIWASGCLVSTPIAWALFLPSKYPTQFILSAAAGAGLLLGFVVLRLYLGWQYIRSRLESAKVVYEESGWYDGQAWPKTPEVLAQDQLIATHQVAPVIQRLHRTFYILGWLFLAGGLIFGFVSLN